MKKIGLLLFTSILSVLFICSCVENQTKAFSNPNNHEFIKILKRYKEFVGNDIQKENALKRRDAQLREDLNLCGVYNNVKCKLDGVNLNNFGKFKMIDFNIELKVDNSFGIRFNCVHPVHKDSVDADYIYNKFKDISGYSEVYVDGFLCYDIEKDVLEYSESSEYTLLSSPNYKFRVVDMSTEKLDTISDNLKSSLILARKSFFNLSKKVRKDKDFSSRETNKAIKDYNNSLKQLSEKEKSYALRYKKYMDFDLY